MRKGIKHIEIKFRQIFPSSCRKKYGNYRFVTEETSIISEHFKFWEIPKQLYPCLHQSNDIQMCGLFLKKLLQMISVTPVSLTCNRHLVVAYWQFIPAMKDNLSSFNAPSIRIICPQNRSKFCNGHQSLSGPNVLLKSDSLLFIHYYYQYRNLPLTHIIILIRQNLCIYLYAMKSQTKFTAVNNFNSNRSLR